MGRLKMGITGVNIGLIRDISTHTKSSESWPLTLNPKPQTINPTSYRSSHFLLEEILSPPDPVSIEIPTRMHSSTRPSSGLIPRLQTRFRV